MIDFSLTLPKPCLPLSWPRPNPGLTYTQSRPNMTKAWPRYDLIRFFEINVKASKNHQENIYKLLRCHLESSFLMLDRCLLQIFSFSNVMQSKPKNSTIKWEYKKLWIVLLPQVCVFRKAINTLSPYIIITLINISIINLFKINTLRPSSPPFFTSFWHVSRSTQFKLSFIRHNPD